MSKNYERMLASAHNQLFQAQQLISYEISKFPTATSRLDAQYDKLINDEKRIAEALQALNAQQYTPAHLGRMADTGLERH